MMNAEMLFDLVLFIGSIMIAILCLITRDLFKGIVLFISLGLIVTLAWARLGAWDVAIAEAAIGSGLTGALLLATWRQLKSSSVKKSDQNQEH
ncbi:Na(+)/H(+) antiporter subunit B [Algicola sagamiensis]|uniref:Na(+)/H(+) antiporter subunit B n=1 Tax=Algicola sagamiensis TaxID=163869 RepID=UPI0003A45F41|nr:DUF4040 domain-containing protein [Algicola sagamiensis]